MRQEIKDRIEKIRNGEVPEGYKEVGNNLIPFEWKLDKTLNLIKRIRKPVSVELAQKYRQIGIRSHGKGIFYKDEVSGEQLGNKAVFWVEPDCFIVNIVFAWEMAVAKTTINERGMIASHRFPMYKPVLNLLDLDYLTYYFKSNQGRTLLELASPGGAGRNKTLGQTEFLELNIPVPSLPEQQKIAFILSTWDKAIELKEQLIEQKREQKRGLMKKLLTGEMRLPGIHGKWEEVRLGDVADMHSGGTPKSTISEYYDGDVPWVSIADMTKRGKYIEYTERNISKLGLENSSAKLYPKGTVLYAMYASIGECSISKIELTSSQAILGIRPKKHLNNEFLYYYLFSMKEKLKLNGQKGTQSNLNTGIVKDLKIVLPEIDEQMAIVNILLTSDKGIELLEQELEALKLQKKGLMQLLLTGIVRVQN
ncbi:restriction endonuclease subunit S [Phosphitispora fastidiosa]|uniref:restriction endonuclease subunit S n=1 Tax=Phosphitispora fastidiosa TaxID=2837202 RepID=UPI001E573FC4|nr:type I restriction enzyme S subunit [Phosphitispora fastidiosa]